MREALSHHEFIARQQARAFLPPLPEVRGRSTPKACPQDTGGSRPTQVKGGSREADGITWCTVLASARPTSTARRETAGCISIFKMLNTDIPAHLSLFNMLNIVIARTRRLISRDPDVLVACWADSIAFRHVVVTRALGSRTVWVGA